MSQAAPYDCRRCGACCANPLENAAEGFIDWVEVEQGAPLLTRPALVAKYVRVNANGERHLALTPEGRCRALRGQLGQRVRCDVYALRPRACRRVMPGDPRCEQYRRERGIGATARQPPR